MTFHCDTCNQARDFDKDYSLYIINRRNEVSRVCRSCRGRSSVSFPDVYFDGKPEENLADDPHTGKPRVFSSRGEKAAYLRERGIMEAGDLIHGAPYSTSGNPGKVDSRHEVRMALKKVKEMGKDVRRQEYLRITKGGTLAVSKS